MSRRPTPTSLISRLSLDLLIRSIDNVLLGSNNQGSGCKIMESRTELRDLVQPVASDFSKLFDRISEAAKMFSDEKFLKSQLSAEAHSVAVDVLKGLGSAHWVAVGLLAVANVLDRFDNISANDRECIDLLKAMVSGAILCCSFITSNKLSKFVLTKKIRDELVYVRGKVDSMKADLMLQLQVLTITTFSSYYLRQYDDTDVCIVYRNVKPRNILLDENFDAKICDFGFARAKAPGHVQYANVESYENGFLFLRDATDLSGYETTRLAGTSGYLAPEYIATGRVSTKADIYAFGVTVLNVVSGKKALPPGDELISLTKLAWRLFEEDRIEELIEPRLPSSDVSINSSSIIRTFKIALLYAQEDPEKRPSASRVLAMLLSEEEVRVSHRLC